MTNKTVVIVAHLPKENGGCFLPLIRERGFSTHIVKLYKGEQIPDVGSYDALIVMGGLMSANSKKDPMLHELYSIGQVLKHQKPYFGICLGMQALIKVAGGEIVRSSRKEIGFREDYSDPHSPTFALKITSEGRKDPLFNGFTTDMIDPVFQLHRATVKFRPNMNYPVTLLATDRNEVVPHQVMRVGNNAYGIQAHRELSHESLLLWLNQYAALGQYGIKEKWEMIREYDRYEAEYTKTSLMLFNNFLDLI